jgi:double-stranded uracil-DNA glycosylase
MASIDPEPSQCLPPVVDPNVRVLILGSLPGRRSLAQAQYYAHPQNAFWRLLEGVLGEPLVPLAYPRRLERLLARRVGLWDVVAEARRPGSLDSAMRAVAANPLPEMVARLPRLEVIAFNGATAARIGRRALGEAGLTLIDLPSSSPAFTMPIERKAERWAELVGHVDRPPAAPPA